MQTELDALNNAAPQNKEEQHEIFVWKKGNLEEDSNKGGAIKLAGQIWSDEIYARIPGFYHNLIVVETL